MDPTAVFAEVGEGADGLEHFGAGEVARVNRFDDVCESGLQVAVAQREKIEGVGVLVDGGFSFDVEAVHDRLRTAPVEEGFVYQLAQRMAADGALAGVAFEEGGFGPFAFAFAAGFWGGAQRWLVVGGRRRRERRACGDDIGDERVEELLRVFITRIGVGGIGVSGIRVSGVGACGFGRCEGGGLWFRWRGSVIFKEFQSGNRIWSGRGAEGLRRSAPEGGGLPFAFLSRGFDEFGVGADFAVGVLQGGEGEAIVTISLNNSFHISLLAQGSTHETNKQLYGSVGTGKIGTGEVQN